MAEEKIRINSLAKDFGVKSKDIVDLLGAHGFAGKSAMTALEPDELSVVFEYYTQNNQVDITAFFKLYDEKKAAKKKAEEEAEAKRKEELRKAREAMNPKKTEQGKGQKQQQQPKRSKTDVRVVDTRGTQAIDVSKYDEKFDSFVTEPDNVRSGGKTKIKKKNRSDIQQEQSRGDKRRFGDRNKPKQQPKPVQLKIAVPDEISVGELAREMKISAPEVIKKLMTMGVMASVSDVIDYDTAYLVADEFKIKVEKKVVVSLEDRLFGEEKADTEEQLVPRPPVVVVMGHVDHGKTSPLDAIRNTQVTKGEAGGITQAIGAYSVQINGSDITFLDTPGHEAFTAMRARGANMTDIAVLVVAADDGIMPQTIEAINHAKAAGVNIIVAINKIDKPGADPERVKEELTKYDLLPEEWGGDTICVPISAIKHQNIDKLLEMIILSAEMMELKANPARQAKGAIVEAPLDKGRGAVATVLVQNGTLRVGDIIIAGTTTGKVRQMYDDKGRLVKEAGPSTPVEITGLSEVPDAGDLFQVVSDERLARELCEQRKAEAKEKTFGASKVSLDDLFGRIENGQKTLNIIVKADVHGSAEAVKSSLEKLNNEEVSVKVIHAGVGGITESDVMLASASDAFIVGFNVRPDRQALDLAARDKVDIKTYSIIYECIEEIQAAMKGMLAPKFRENVLGRAEVRKTIRVPNVGTIAGSYITDGKVTRSSSIRVIRDGVVIFEDKISSLKRFKDDAREVAQSFECGIGLERFNDLKEGDILEAYVMEEIPR
ncbi:MAG: translation initiation factor IF-2 [Clostridia bacterium]|nr:translation initiation factor IF-2 [Clostridia bacterium]